MEGIPPARDTDAEDVAWALQTADALWKRNERVDAIVWLRRAAQSAGEANDDERAVTLAREAARLAELIAAAPTGSPAAPSAPASPPGDEQQSNQVDDLLRRSAAHFDEADGDVRPAIPPAAPDEEKPVTAAPAPIAVDVPPVSEAAASVEEPPRVSVPGADQTHAGMLDPWSDAQPAPAPAPAPPPSAPNRSAPAPAPASPARFEDEVVTSARQIIPTPSAFPERESPTKPKASTVVSEPAPSIHHVAEVGPAASEVEVASTELISVPPPPLAPSAPPVPPAARKPPPVPRPAPPPLPKKKGTPSSGSMPAAPPPPAVPAIAVPPPPAPPVIERPPPAIAAPPPAPAPPRIIPAPVAPVPSPVVKVSEPPTPSEDLQPVAPVDLNGVDAFADLPDDAREAFALAAKMSDLAKDEEVNHFALAYVVEGDVDVSATMVDAPAVRYQAGVVLRARGSIDDQVPLRLICASDTASIATWNESDVEAAFKACPWVEDDLRAAADRAQALAGVTVGPLGERLDRSLRDSVMSRLDLKVLQPGDVLVEKGKPVPGLLVVGVGDLELVDGGAVKQTLGSGDFVFADAVLHAGPAPFTARAGKGGALVMSASRATAQELLVTCPPLLELFAGM